MRFVRPRHGIALLLLVSFASAQYLEHWLPIASPTASGAVGFPCDLAYSTSSGKFYVHGYTGWVAVISGTEHQIVGDIPLSPSSAWALARSVWSRHVNKVYFRNQQGVAVVNCATDSLEATIPLSRDGAQGIAFNDSGNCLVVACADSLTLAIIDGTTSQIRARLPLTRQPFQVTWDSRDNRYFVLQNNSQSRSDSAFMTVFDAATEAVLDSFRLDAEYMGAPEMVYVPTSNKVYVPCESSVVAIDAATLQVLKYLPARASRLCWNSVHNRLYCAGESTLVVDCDRDSIVGSIPNGLHDFPGLGVAYNPVDDKFYLADPESDSLCIVDGGSNAVLARLPVSGFDLPRHVTAMVWNPDDDRLYATLWPDIILAVDGVTNRYCDSIRTCRLVDGIAFNPALNRLYIMSDLIRRSGDLDGRVLSVDGTTNEHRTWIPVGTCEEADIALVEGGTKLYITTELDGMVGVVDCVRESLLRRLDASYPVSLAYDSIRHRVFCVDNFQGNGGVLRVFDSRADTAIAVVTVPLQSPRFVAWFPTVNKVYVQDWYGRLAVSDGDSLRFQRYIEFSGVPGKAPCCNYRDSKLYTGDNWGVDPGLVVIDALRDSIVAVFDSFRFSWGTVWNEATDKVYTAGQMVFEPSGPLCVIAVDGVTNRLLKTIPFTGGNGGEILASHPFLDRVYCEIAGGYDPGGGLGVIDCTRDSLLSVVTCPQLYGMVSPLELAFDPNLGRVYVADGNRVFVVRDAAPGIEEGESARDNRAIECSPNPMTRELTIRLGLPNLHWTTLAIYDCAGRKVREFSRPGMSSSVWHWNGTDQAGRAVGPGMYFVRVANQQEQVTRKVAKVR